MWFSLKHAFRRLTLESLKNASVMSKYYAVAKGRKVGIYNSWDACKQNVLTYFGAKYKKFSTEEDALAFIATFQDASVKSPAEHPTTSTSDEDQLPSLKLKLAVLEEELQLYTKLKESEIMLVRQKIIQLEEGNSDGQPLVKKFKTNMLPGQSTREICTIAPQLAPNTPKTKSFHEMKVIQYNSNEYRCDGDGYVHVYTDGACESNGFVGAKAGLGVWFGDEHPCNVSRQVEGRATNNCGEIQAATVAVQQAKVAGIEKLCINTDSEFVINAVTKWMSGWKKKNWKLKSGGPVKNKEDFEELNNAMEGIDITWNHVRGHCGNYGNEAADRLARDGASQYKPVPHK